MGGQTFSVKDQKYHITSVVTSTLLYHIVTGAIDNNQMGMTVLE